MISATLDLTEAGTRTWDVIVVGAGPAGALASHELARRGAAVLLVDKARFPRGKVCGCCLNLDALATLQRVGLTPRIEQCVPVPLTLLNLAAVGTRAAVPLTGMALSRPALDAALVQATVEAGGAFLPEAHARLGPTIDATRVVIIKQGGQEKQVHARVVLGADGLGGGLLAHEPGHRPVVQEGSRLGAGVMADGTTDYEAGAIFMACGPGGYVGLVRIEDGRLNIAAAFDATFVKRKGGLGRAAATVLGEVGFPAVAGLESLPWHGTPLLTRRARYPAAERVFLLGDAASYVEPFSGEGMAWALAAGAAVVPFALRAVRQWDSSLKGAWTRCHRRAICQRQGICQAAAYVLRRPRVVRLLVAALGRYPMLAAPVLRLINHGQPG